MIRRPDLKVPLVPRQTETHARDLSIHIWEMQVTEGGSSAVTLNQRVYNTIGLWGLKIKVTNNERDVWVTGRSSGTRWEKAQLFDQALLEYFYREWVSGTLKPLKDRGIEYGPRAHAWGDHAVTDPPL